MKNLKFMAILLIAASLYFTACDSDDEGIPDVDVTFISATQTGGTSAVVESSGILLEFDTDPETLTADNISVNGATKGELTGTGSQRIIEISNINVANNGTVTVEISNPSGYSITGSPKIVIVYRITVANMTIGMDYRGGKLAYILKSGDPGYNSNVPHGLIAATADHSTEIEWNNGIYTITGATGTALGTGKANTTAIITNQGAGNYAAQVCDDYTNTDTGTGVYSDWYLPSKDELNKIYTNNVHIGDFADGPYWSSSENNSTLAWAQSFITGSQGGSSKNETVWVRAVRDF